jgi:hypothetical protein
MDYRKRLLIILLVSVIVPTAVFAGAQQESPYVAAVNNEVKLADNWSFTWRFEGDYIQFTMVAPTTGWVSLGFNPTRMMKDADYILAYVSNGKVTIRDDYGTGNTTHAADTTLGGTQKVEIVSGIEQAGKTTVTFRLPLNSGDTYDVVFARGQTYKVLAAYGADGQDNFTARHKARTSVNVTF